LAKVRYAPEAKGDLADIWSYIAADNPRAADRLVSNVIEHCEMLARLPGVGRLRADLAPELRSFPVGDYVVFYLVNKGGIFVVRVLSGYRNLDLVFRG
jgi:toxin ParE1/3/4